MKEEFALYPKYYENYLRTFDRMVQARAASGLPPLWKDGQQVMDWYVGDYHFPKEDKQYQMTLDEYRNVEED